jgi:multiple sugar transport system ATP-binding protein
MVYVTHDQVEAMTLGDRIIVMNAGVVQQIGTPTELYERPANRFVAGFVGSPAMNFIEGSVHGADGRMRFRSDDGAVEVPLDTTGREQGRAVLGIRPESIFVDGGPWVPHRTAPVDARLDVIEPMGSEIVLSARAQDHELVARVAPQPLPEPEAPIRLLIDVTKVYLFEP